MAIDTKAKRASVQAYTLGLMRPPPDGTVGTQDRPVLAWLYSGIVYGNEVIEVITGLFGSLGLFGRRNDGMMGASGFFGKLED